MRDLAVLVQRRVDSLVHRRVDREIRRGRGLTVRDQIDEVAFARRLHRRVGAALFANGGGALG
jgi:hypothetical protein